MRGKSARGPEGAIKSMDRGQRKGVRHMARKGHRKHGRKGR